MTAEKQLTVNCPNCGKAVTWTDVSQFRPFCCERCKLIDLGEWAAEEKVIPGEPVQAENDDQSNFTLQ